MAFATLSVCSLDYAFTIIISNFRWVIIVSTRSLSGFARRWVTSKEVGRSPNLHLTSYSFPNNRPLKVWCSNLLSYRPIFSYFSFSSDIMSLPQNFPIASENLFCFLRIFPMKFYSFSFQG